MPNLTKKEGLFLSRLHDQGGRLAISENNNKYDRLIKAGYVLSEDESFRPDTVHLTLTATGRGALEIHEKKAPAVSSLTLKTHQQAYLTRGKTFSTRAALRAPEYRLLRCIFKQ